MTDGLKYALPEIELRWLVDISQAPRLENLPYRLIEDRYLDGGLLRLRRVTDPTGAVETIYKLCKKYGKVNESEFITNIYLSLSEYEALAGLPGNDLVKRRYRVEDGALDVFLLPEGIPPVFEVEFKSVDEARTYLPPSFVTVEVTNEVGFSCANLARIAPEGHP